MDQRGRKSGDSLTVLPPPEHIRPNPPDELSSREQSQWQGIVARMPADWFTRESHELLTAYIRHCTTNSYLSRQISEAMENGQEIDKLVAQRHKESSAMVSLARSMRLSQITRYRGETAATKVKNQGKGAAPWNADNGTSTG